ncbi:hypothetical protein PAXINDRAFT_170078 [Paxillus involutus ATCC 200175]|uniref:Uncharacterized protein n=1 Tax=Paxillus involutus ATCC 200175 TaxID=664439 RepID=A0A0C9TEE7_PAXIN|nr:hypothetical protein PAXINDRAFT_170078 [Paxillus involutus ATCC 200175]
MDKIFSTGTSKGSEPELPRTELLDITTHSKKIAAHIRSAFDNPLAKFHPASAPGHVERVQNVSESVGQAQQSIIRVGEKYAVKQGVLEPYLAVIRPYVQKLWVLVGDVAELHPRTIPKLILNLMEIFVPGVAFVKPLVTLFFFGPCMVVSDFIGGWMFKAVWEVLTAFV